MSGLVGRGTKRQLADHTRDFGRAANRHVRQSRAGLDRRESRARELVERECAVLGERMRRRLDDARRDALHQAELITAQDFRRHGWVLASTGSGRPARSATDLTTGARIDLHLHDGRAGAVIESITHNDGSSAT